MLRKKEKVVSDIIFHLVSIVFYLSHWSLAGWLDVQESLGELRELGSWQVSRWLAGLLVNCWVMRFHSNKKITEQLTFFDSASHILVLALQLFLSVNGWLRGISDLVKQITYFSFIFGSGFVIVMINAFAYGDKAFGTNAL